MEENFDALEVIARTRGKVEMSYSPTGGKLFLVCGWPAAVFFLLEFLFWHWFQQEWCLWLWIGIPIVALPLMVHYLKKDHSRTHSRTRESKIILNYWIFVGATTFISGFIFGFAGLYEDCFFPQVCLLMGIGCFITGQLLRFRPKSICGLVGSAIGICSFMLKGDLWYWQLLAISLVSVITLILPGIQYKRHVRNAV